MTHLRSNYKLTLERRTEARSHSKLRTSNDPPRIFSCGYTGAITHTHKIFPPSPLYEWARPYGRCTQTKVVPMWVLAAASIGHRAISLLIHISSSLDWPGGAPPHGGFFYSFNEGLEFAKEFSFRWGEETLLMVFKLCNFRRNAWVSSFLFCCCCNTRCIMLNKLECFMFIFRYLFRITHSTLIKDINKKYSSDIMLPMPLLC